MYRFALLLTIIGFLSCKQHYSTLAEKGLRGKVKTMTIVIDYKVLLGNHLENQRLNFTDSFDTEGNILKRVGTHNVPDELKSNEQYFYRDGRLTYYFSSAGGFPVDTIVLEWLNDTTYKTRRYSRFREIEYSRYALDRNYRLKKANRGSYLYNHNGHLVKISVISHTMDKGINEYVDQTFDVVSSDSIGNPREIIETNYNTFDSVPIPYANERRFPRFHNISYSYY